MMNHVEKQGYFFLLQCGQQNIIIIIKNINISFNIISPVYT